MIEQADDNIPLGKFIGWVAINLLATFFIGLIIAFTWPSFNSYVWPSTVGPDLFIISSVCGGIFIAVCQLVFLRRCHIDIPGGKWKWIGSGIIGSIVSFIFIATAIFTLSTEIITSSPNYELVGVINLTIWVISIQMLFLAVVQCVLLKVNQYTKVLLWLIINVFGYALAILITMMIGDSSDFETAIVNNGIAVIYSIFMIVPLVIVEIASGWWFLQVLGTIVALPVVPAFQKVIPSSIALESDSHGQYLRDRSAKGPDFRTVKPKYLPGHIIRPTRKDRN